MVEPITGQEVFRVLYPIVGLAVNVLVQVLSYRWISGMGLLKSVFFGFGVGMLFVLGMETSLYFLNGMFFWNEVLPILVVNLLTYGMLGYCYFHFINLGETARRIRILRELDEHGAMTLEELLRRYNASEMIEKRLSRLIHNGQVLERNDRYYIGNPTVLRMSQVIVLMKRLIMGKESEFG